MDFINQRRKAWKALSVAIMEADADRGRPIMMKTITSALGHFPSVLGFDDGAELHHPRAVPS